MSNCKKMWWLLLEPLGSVQPGDGVLQRQDVGAVALVVELDGNLFALDQLHGQEG